VGLGRLSDPATANASSHLFLAFDRPPDRDYLNRVLSSHPWPMLNMGQPSIGARDYVPVLNKIAAKRTLA
jgi:hypothetical protein